jgi:hypothetical protein
VEVRIKARRPGRDLARDLLLMSVGERAAATDHYMELIRQRNAESERVRGIQERAGLVGEPAELARVTTNWMRLRVPAVLER